eukprot:scaffold78415_cov41-Prasinocladus_malaysianus.AAC.1
MACYMRSPEISLAGIQGGFGHRAARLCLLSTQRNGTLCTAVLSAQQSTSECDTCILDRVFSSHVLDRAELSYDAE